MAEFNPLLEYKATKYIELSMGTGDMFVDRLQGATFQVTVGTKTTTSDPQVYHLPIALFSYHSGYFRDEIAKQFRPIAPCTANAPIQIALHATEPAVFAHFLRFVYATTVDFNTHQIHPFGPGTTSVSQLSFIPPSICAWNLGAFLRAPYFQNASIGHLHTELGRTISLNPQIVSWVYGRNYPGDPLCRLVFDTLVSYWPASTHHILKSPTTNDAWLRVFSAFPEVQRALIIGLQDNKVKVQPVQAYLVPTPREAPRGPHALSNGVVQGSAAAIPAPAAGVRKDTQPVEYLSSLGPKAANVGTVSVAAEKKKGVPQPVIKQEAQPVPLSRAWNASSTSSGRITEPSPAAPAAPAARSPPRARQPSTATQTQHRPEKILDSSKKRTASPSFAQKDAKQQKVLTKSAQSEPKILDAQDSKKRPASPSPAQNDAKQQKVLPQPAQTEPKALDPKEAKTKALSDFMAAALSDKGHEAPKTVATEGGEKAQAETSLVDKE